MSDTMARVDAGEAIYAAIETATELFPGVLRNGMLAFFEMDNQSMYVEMIGDIDDTCTQQEADELVAGQFKVDFFDAWRGTYDSVEDFVWWLVSEEMVVGVPNDGTANESFDAARYGADLVEAGDVWTVRDQDTMQFHVFS